jgi:hydroxyacylglutathione hydrolase
MNLHAWHHPAIRTLTALKDNYIWMLRAQTGRGALVVDPGSAAPVQAALFEENRVLRAILVTHHHRDHIGGIAALRQAWPDAVVYGPENPNIVGIDHSLTNGVVLALEDFGTVFEVLAIPGHTSDHLAYYTPQIAREDPPVLFCGDTLFGAGCGRVFEGTPAQLWQSLNRLKQLPANTLVYCAHEYTLANLAFAQCVEPNNPVLAQRQEDTAAWRAMGTPSIPSRMDLECATNPFLRTHLPSIQNRVADRVGHTGLTEETVFAALRAWKDTF